MSDPTAKKSILLTLLLLVAGLVVGGLSWVLPINLKSVTPPFLTAAGYGTPSLVEQGEAMLEAEKPGPAAMVVRLADALQVAGVESLKRDLDFFDLKQPDLMVWGGWDPFLNPLLNQPEVTEQSGKSTPILDFLATEKAREALNGFLENSRSQTVRTLLQLRDLGNTGRFVPARQAGGQTLDAVILMTALLQQGEHFSESLRRDIRQLADKALVDKQLGDLEPIFINLLSLGRRLDWIQLCEVLRVTESGASLSSLAGVARARPDDFDTACVATLIDGSGERVTHYLNTRGEGAADDLREALTLGSGAVKQLLLRQVPINHQPVPPVGELATLALLYPKPTLLLKYLGWFLSVYLVLRAVDRSVLGLDRLGSSRPHLIASVLALLGAGLLILATEPFLLHPPKPISLNVQLAVPVLTSNNGSLSLIKKSPTLNMDIKTILSISLFASLQVLMYLVCLLKIRQIDASNHPPLLKLRLMENEENLFDGGLYVGIAGTATALVLQVLGLIEPNLLAAYASNLFGITCVALVKIRHVRPYKNKLILAGQDAILASVAPANVTPPAQPAETQA